MSTQPPTPTRIAVLLLPPIQLLDVTPIDLFGMLTPATLSTYPVAPFILAGAVPVSIAYVAPAGPGTVAECTAGAGIRVTHALADLAPGKGKSVEIILVPGPDPRVVPTAEVTEWLRRHAGAGTTVMSVCTGVYAVGYAGLLKGRRVTGPRELLPDLKGKFPEAEWVEKRWVGDRGVWSSGGVTNGQDMVAAYIRAKWPGPTAETVLAVADVSDRGDEYRVSNASPGVEFNDKS